MRWLAFAIVLAASAPASADNGYFIEESIGGVAYSGDLARYGSGAPKFQIGVATRQGAWTYHAFGAFAVTDAFFIDCYGPEECASANMPKADLGWFGVDVRRHWPLWQRWRHSGAFMFLRGGARWFEGSGSLDDFRGLGYGAGAGVEADIWVIGYFLDFGLDVMRLDGPGETLWGHTKHVVIGAKLGWL